MGRVQDPAPRALAAWQRLRDEACREPGSGGGGVCTFPSFESIVTREPGSSLTQGGCFFDDEVRSLRPVATRAHNPRTQKPDSAPRARVPRGSPHGRGHAGAGARAARLRAHITATGTAATSEHVAHTRHRVAQAAGAEARKTWHECHRCRYSHVFLPACDGLFGKHLVDDTFTPCERARAGRGLDVSHAVIGAGQYAAQLAWWLSFFPADRFLLVTTHQLRDAAARVEVRRSPIRLLAARSAARCRVGL